MMVVEWRSFLAFLLPYLLTVLQLRVDFKWKYPFLVIRVRTTETISRQYRNNIWRIHNPADRKKTYLGALETIYKRSGQGVPLESRGRERDACAGIYQRLRTKSPNSFVRKRY